MQPDRAIELLTGHQAAVGALLSRAKRALLSDDADAARMLAPVRWELTRVLREYQLFKHNEIFNPIIAADLGGRSRAAAALRTRCVAVGEAYADHVRCWSLQSPGSAWTNYQAEALQLVRRIEQHLAFEANEVRILLQGVARTRRP